MNDFKKLTLLVLTPDFPDEDDRYIGGIYVKNQIDGLKKHFKKIIVIAPILTTCKVMPLDKYCFDYTYDNVIVYYPRCFFIPRMVPVFSNDLKAKFDYRCKAIMDCVYTNKLKFDLIHSHFTYPSSYCAVLLKNRLNVPYIITINEDSGWLNEEIQLNNHRFIYTWGNASKIISLNTNDIKKIVPYNKNTCVVPYGYNPVFFPRSQSWCRDYLNLPRNDKILFTVGILQKRKGFDYLIESLSDIRGKRKDIHCYIGGNSVIETTYASSLKKLIKSLNLKDYVHLFGFINQLDLPLWMNACDLYVSSSLEEGLGITQLEALGCGKPVIATKTCGSLDIIKNPDVGYLCDCADSKSLTKGILYGLDKDWDSNYILKYASKYHQENLTDQILNIYEEVLNDR